ncbi:SNF2 family N-terminal domain-containing protein [Emericellopsis atlantica]|uniref:SNF2 family N-terminal domain-containing protein n=1 Tax=Emericellopsis atlantica TaxID=2614577 RepID=A0A9P8CQF6_9HYPO|nr:SNF2 family N-terminal domain-containing protein [Emericellopsis atlantica]KAG9255869.1 SNF2 family N-terminal domain-containing protein [Emericellopsis atlantica]
MSQPRKRSWRDVVDLTGENSDHEPPSQTRRLHYATSTSIPTPTLTLEPDSVDLTQEDDGPIRELYGTFDGKIVGIRYYNGRVSPGELVLCIREPQNKFDSNAIRIDNVMGQQVGHLPRKVVTKLAPYVDRGDLVIEGQLTGEKGFYDCPAKLSFYGPSDATQRATIEANLKKDKLVKATQLKQTKKDAEARRRIQDLRNGGSTAGVGEAVVIEDEPTVTLVSLLSNSEAVDFRADKDAIKTLALSEEQLAQMPQAAQPPQLSATLLPYQLQALAWMTAKEHPSLPNTDKDDAVQLWRRHPNKLYWNIATDFYTKIPPQLLSGGILADDMGLGKTLETISLIVTGGPGSTLIVAPVSVMSNWEQQIQRHVRKENQPSTIIYHVGKKLTAKELLEYDVVITSYGKLTSDSILTSDKVEWRRVVLDEGHTIRNSKTKVAMAAYKLQAKSRWVLTGTPIINHVKDLQSLVRFLGIRGGIEQPDIFNSVITRRLGDSDRVGEALLQNLMQDVCLRRRKDMKFVDLKLPEKKEFVQRIPFYPEEKQKYDALLAEAKGALEQFQARENVQTGGRFTNVLERLLRLRQVCNHWTLCKSRVEDLMRLLEDEDVVELTPKNTALLQEALRLYIESQEDCAICYDTPAAPVITHCKHVFCRGCITRAIQIQHKCPMCRNQLEEDHLLEPAPEEGEADVNFDGETQSSKTEAITQIIKAVTNKRGSKVIVFSQWTSFLTVVQAQLEAKGIKFTRIDGSMNIAKRDQAIAALDNDDETRVMLASLSVCSVGLNLVSADTVILSDSWWAPAIEDQAIDRVHRLGQTRETTVFRLVMEGSVEDRVLDIQRDKRELVSKAFHEKGENKKKAKETRLADLQKLLG